MNSSTEPVTNHTHTPGPWKAEWLTRSVPGPKMGWYIFSEYDQEGDSDIDLNDAIATLPDCERLGEGDTEGNARLIAAAPELLEVLELESIEHDGAISLHEQLKLFVSKGWDATMGTWGEWLGEKRRAAIAKAKGE